MALVTYTGTAGIVSPGAADKGGGGMTATTIQGSRKVAHIFTG